MPGLGARVRVQLRALGSEKLVGTVTAIDPTTLTVLPEAGSEPAVLVREDIVRLEQRTQPSRKGRGALIGFGAGVALTLGKALIQGGCNDGCDSSNVLVAALVTLSTTTVGAVVAPGERWEDVARGAEVRLVPQVGRRIGLTVVASF